MSQESSRFTRTYAEAGVDRDQLQRLKDKALKVCQETKIEEVDEITSGNFWLNLEKVAEKIPNPVERWETDGIGTKEKLLALYGKHKIAGWDLVVANINDILRWGASPKTISIGVTYSQISDEVYFEIMEGVKTACLETGVMLVGGETAQHPDFLPENSYHLTGTATGFAQAEKIITGEKVCSGDIVLGLASSGLHTNGFSFAERIIDGFISWQTEFAQLRGENLADTLLLAHKSYFAQVRKLQDSGVEIHSMVHVTGGGLAKRLVEKLHPGLSVKLNKKGWPQLPIFDFLQNFGRITDSEMYKTFNMGIGWLIFLPASEVEVAEKNLAEISEEVYIVGLVVKE